MCNDGLQQAAAGLIRQPPACASWKKKREKGLLILVLYKLTNCEAFVKC